MSDSTSRPKCCGSAPKVQMMESGTYWWCSCGLSDHQPFCDGSHKGSGYSPIKHVVESPQKVAWCMCKKSQAGALCDGSHKDHLCDSN